MADAPADIQVSAPFGWGDPFSDKGIRFTWELDQMNPICLVLRQFKSILGCSCEKEVRQYKGIAREVEKRRSTGLFEATLLEFAQESARFREDVINAVRGDMDAKQADRATRVVEHPFDMDEKQFKLLMPEDQLAAAGGALLNIHDDVYYTDRPIAPQSFIYTGSPIDQERMAPQPAVARFMLELIDREVGRRRNPYSVEILSIKERKLWDALNEHPQKAKVLFRRLGFEGPQGVKNAANRIRKKLGEYAICSATRGYWREDARG